MLHLEHAMLGDAGTFLVHMMYVQHDSSTTEALLFYNLHRDSVIEYVSG